MISFLGTGLLGANFTRAMLKRGESVNVWNRTVAKAKALEKEGAKAFVEVAEAVKGATRIHLTLSDDKAVDEVLNNASKNISKGVFIIDHTTTSVDGSAKRSKKWAEKGIHYIHAPVFMGPPQALEGTGTMLISGNQELIAQLTPELSKMTGKLLNLGEQPEKAAAIKLIGNLFHICLAGGVSDVITLAGTLNISTEEISSLFDLINPGAVAQGRLKKITSNTFDQASWELSMARKDARLMIEQVNGAGKKLTVVPAVAQRMDAWIEKGKGHSDWTIFSQE